MPLKSSNKRKNNAVHSFVRYRKQLEPKWPRTEEEEEEEEKTRTSRTRLKRGIGRKDMKGEDDEGQE